MLHEINEMLPNPIPENKMQLNYDSKFVILHNLIYNTKYYNEIILYTIHIEVIILF